MIAVLQQIAAHHGLGRLDLAVGKHAARRDDRGGKARKLGYVSGGVIGLSAPARHGVELLQRPPAPGQRRIERYRPLEGSYGRCRRALRDMAVAPFLVQSGVIRMQLLEPHERCQCRGDPAQIALSDGEHVEELTLLGSLGKQPLGSPCCLGELPPIEEVAHARRPCSGARRSGAVVLHRYPKGYGLSREILPQSRPGTFRAQRCSEKL